MPKELTSVFSSAALPSDTDITPRRALQRLSITLSYAVSLSIKELVPSEVATVFTD